MAGLAVAGACLLTGIPAAHAASTSPLPPGAVQQFVNDVMNAYSLTRGGGVTVAVLSTGVDPSASGLSGRVTTGPDYTYPPTIPLRHAYGTLVASLIAGGGPTGSSPLNVPGIAPEAKILSVRTNPDPTERGVDAFYANADLNGINAKAIRYAVGRGAQVIFVDMDTQQTPASDLWSAIQFAIAKKAVIIGSEYSYGGTPDAYVYPAGLPGVIGPAAVTLSGAPAPYENSRSARNNSILVAAPGNSVYTLDGWQIDGPGAATAWVTGTVALIKSVYPDLSPALVARALATSARYHPSGGYDTSIGFGLVNADGALMAAGTLAKLSQEAGSGRSVTADTSFWPGPPPGTIDAVHHSTTKLALLGGIIAAGLAMLLAGLGLAVRRRRSRAVGGTPA
jgi:hypothetical protein